MGRIMNKMLNFVGFPQEDEYDDEYDDVMEEDYEEDYVRPNAFDRFSDRRSSRVVKLHDSSAQMRVVVIQPESFEESRDITNHLKDRRPIVVNLEIVDSNVARRIVDFLSGAVYALDGSIQKVSNKIFVIAPNNVELLSESVKAGKVSYSWE